MKLLYFNICLWSLCIIICIFISFITLHKTNKIIHNLPQLCNKNNISESFTPYNDSYTNGFSIATVSCSNLDVSQNLNTTADIKSTGNVIVKSIDNIKIQEETNKEAKTLLQTLYPVGSIYMSMNSTDPSTFIGGEWVLIQNRFLLSVGTNTDSKTEGGSDTITTEHLPSHNHGINITSKNTDVKHKHPIKSEYDNYDYNTVAHDSNFGKFIDELLKSNINSIPLDTSAKYYDWNKRYYRTTYTEDTSINHNHKVEGNTGSTGNGKSYKPPYITCYIWYRTG